MKKVEECPGLRFSLLLVVGGLIRSGLAAKYMVANDEERREPRHSLTYFHSSNYSRASNSHVRHGSEPAANRASVSASSVSATHNRLMCGSGTAPRHRSEPNSPPSPYTRLA